MLGKNWASSKREKRKNLQVKGGLLVMAGKKEADRSGMDWVGRRQVCSQGPGGQDAGPQSR